MTEYIIEMWFIGNQYLIYFETDMLYFANVIFVSINFKKDESVSCFYKEIMKKCQRKH